MTRGRRLAPLVAGGLAAATYAVASAIRGVYPFGAISRNTNDLGSQVIPMQMLYRDVLTGHAPGDLLWNWNSGFGVPFIGDLAAYVGTTLSATALVFPRDRGDLALWVEALTALALGASLMTAYLLRLRPEGSRWLAAAAGLSYGVCGWALDDGIYMTHWLQGLAIFPALLLVAETMLRSRSARSLALGSVIVAVLWSTQFYVAYMATIGAGLVTLARVLAFPPEDWPWRQRGIGVLRAALAMGFGMGMAAPLLAPTFYVVRAATPSPSQPFGAEEWSVFFSRLLPGTEGVGTSPGLAVGTLLLVAALGLVAHPRVPVRERVGAVLLMALMLASMQIRITHDIWHGFDPPNGSQYRQAFVAAGIMVIVGWLGLARGVSRAHLGTGAVAALGLYAWTRGDGPVTPTATFLLPLSVGLLLVCLLLLALGSASRTRRMVVGAAVLAIVFGEGVAAAVAIDAQRITFLKPQPLWSHANDEVRSLVLAAPSWPHGRTSPSRLITHNDPMLLGGQGGEYYSSTIPFTVTRVLGGAGFGYSSFGRALWDPANPVLDAVFSVTGRVRDGHQNPGVPGLPRRPHHPEITHQPAVPFLSLRGGQMRSTDPVPFGPQEDMLGADVYRVPTVRVAAPAGVIVSDRGPRIRVQAPDDREVTFRLSAACPAGSQVFLWAPTLVGSFLQGAEWRTALPPNARRPPLYTQLPLQEAGRATAEGKAVVEIRVPGRATLPPRPLGCLDRRALARAVDTLKRDAPPRIHVEGHSFRATLAPGSSGQLVAATVRIRGWECRVDQGRWRPPSDSGGLLSVPVTASSREVSCSFRPDGLQRGLLIGLAAVVGLIGACAATLLVSRRTRRRRLLLD